MASTAPYGTRNPVHFHIGEDVDGSERHRLWRDAQVPNMVPDDLDEAGDDGYWLMSDPSHRRPHVRTIMKVHTEGHRQSCRI